jgi:hypothetical protein
VRRLKMKKLTRKENGMNSLILLREDLEIETITTLSVLKKNKVKVV